MASLALSKKTATNILDIVGVDILGSYDRSLQYQLLSDTYTISSGGMNVGGNYNIQIQLRQDNALHFLKRSGIYFDYIANTFSFPHNAAALFTGLEMSIGGVTLATPFQHYYVQQRLSKMGKKKLERYSNAICMKYDDIAGTASFNEAGGVLSVIPGATRTQIVNAGVAGGGGARDVEVISPVLINTFAREMQR